MARSLPLSLIFVSCFAAACSDDGPGSSDASTESSTAADPGPGSTDEEGTREGNSSEGNDTEGSSSDADADGSDEGSSGSSDGGDAIEITCELFESRVAAEIESEAIGFQFIGGGVAVSALGIRVGFEGGRAYLRHALDHVEPPRPVSGTGYVRMPDEGPRARQWYCADDSSQYENPADGYYRARFSRLRALGPCPGTPVDGEVSVCFGDASCGGATEFVSDIEGAAFNVPIGGSIAEGGKIGGSEWDIEFDLAWSEGGEARLQAVGIDLEAVGPRQATLDDAYFIIPLGEPDEGAVYCAQSESTFEYSVVRGLPEPISAHLTGISRLGTCDGASGDDGTLEVCMNYGP